MTIAVMAMMLFAAALKPSTPSMLVASDDMDSNDVSAFAEALSLTQREYVIAGYLVRGYTADKIAETEMLSVNTVRTHIKNIYRKAGTHSRQEFIDLFEEGR